MLGKIAFCAIMALACLTPLSAQASFSNAQSVEGAISETVKTKFGTFKTRDGAKIERYDSGAVKSFFIEGKQTIETSVGTFQVETPLNWTATKNQPIEFHENGNLKTLFVGAHSSNGGTQILKTPLGSISCSGKVPIQFHENGRLKSFSPAGGQTAPFLTALDSKGKFQGGKEIEFYDDGNLRAFAPNVALNLNLPLGLKMKARTSIVLSRTGVPIEFVPSDGSALNLGDGIQVSLRDEMPLKFYERGTVKEISFKYSDAEFEFYGLKFLMPKEGGSFGVTIRFYEDEKIRSAEATERQGNTPYSQSISSPPFETELEGDVVKVRKLSFNENGLIEFVEYGDRPAVLSLSELPYDKNAGAGVEELSANKVWYCSGKRIAAIGCHAKTYSQRFYSTSENCVFLCDGDKILRTIEVKNAMPREVMFDGEGKPIAYLAEDMDGRQTTVEIK